MDPDAKKGFCARIAIIAVILTFIRRHFRADSGKALQAAGVALGPAIRFSG